MRQYKCIDSKFGLRFFLHVIRIFLLAFIYNRKLNIHRFDMVIRIKSNLFANADFRSMQIDLWFIETSPQVWYTLNLTKSVDEKYESKLRITWKNCTIRILTSQALLKKIVRFEAKPGLSQSIDMRSICYNVLIWRSCCHTLGITMPCDQEVHFNSYKCNN